MNNILRVFQFGWHYLRRYKARLAAGLLLGMLFGLSSASFVWATKTLIDRFNPESAPGALTEAAVAGHAFQEPASPVIQHLNAVRDKANQLIDPWLPRAGVRLNWQQILGGLFLLPVLVLIRSSMDYGSSYCMGWVSERVINDMRLEVLEKLSTLSMNFFTRSTTGDLLTRVNGDTGQLLRCLKQGSADLIKEPISLLGVLGALLWMNWKLTLFAFIFMPLCLFPLLVLGRKARKASRASVAAEILQSSQLVEFISSIRIIKAYNLEGTQLERYRKLARELVRQGMKGVRAKELVNPLIEVISMLGLGILIVYIFMTQTSVGDFVGFMTGMMLSFLPIKKLARVHILFEQASVGVQRLADIIGQQPTVKEPADPKPLTPFQSEIRFEDVSFAYESSPVIQELSLTIPRGRKIGVAGPSGSGKSTVVNLLFRFYDPSDGAITFDGVDLREVLLRDIRAQMALVSQDVVLFDQTIAENIALGRPDASRIEIEEAGRHANAHEFIMHLPHGYDTRVGERGVTLSGGQRQRIAIARAFVRNAPILVLDEATASLDSQAEAEVQKAIDHLSEGRTVICVAHRLSTLAGCDWIVVLANGRILEQGRFDELLRAGGTFATMAKRQGIVYAEWSADK